MNHEIKVWDPLVRIFHWTMVIAFFTAYISGDDFETLHIWMGYLIAGLIVFRLFWGFIGPKYARFTNFVHPPKIVMNYLSDLMAFKAKRYIGHNPAGGAMVVLLLVSLSITTLSGFELLAAEKGEGPFAQSNISLISDARADDDDEYRHGEDSVWEEIHEFFSNLTLFLVFLHIAGVLVSSIAHGENLPRAMLTGRKKPEHK